MDCRFFESCSSPICPEEPSSFGASWYPGEEVCRKRLELPWIDTQRKINRKGVPWEAGAFTLEMLKRVNKVSLGMRGVEDPADPEEVSKWFEKHPGKREPTEAERESWKARGKALLASRRGQGRVFELESV